MRSLTSCSDATEGWFVGLVYGIGGLSLQIILTQMFKALGGLYARDPGFLAHQVIALAFMITLTYVGALEWATNGSMRASTAQERVFRENPVSRWLAAVALGELLFWDLPCGTILVKSLRDPLMLGHHVAMAVVAYVGMAEIPSDYYLFYFGIVELSSIPLAIVDVFHPKKLEALTKESPILASLNEFARVMFVLLFLCVRAIAFPYVTLFWLVPDVLSVLPKTDPSKHWQLYIILVSSCALTALQLYWATLVTKQVVKLFQPPDRKAKTK